MTLQQKSDEYIISGNPVIFGIPDKYLDKKIGTMYGANLFIDTDDDVLVRLATKQLQNLIMDGNKEEIRVRMSLAKSNLSTREKIIFVLRHLKKLWIFRNHKYREFAWNYTRWGIGFYVLSDEMTKAIYQIYYFGITKWIRAKLYRKFTRFNRNFK